MQPCIGALACEPFGKCSKSAEAPPHSKTWRIHRQTQWRRRMRTERIRLLSFVHPSISQSLSENTLMGGTGHWPVAAGHQPPPGLRGQLAPEKGGGAASPFFLKRPVVCAAGGQQTPR